MATLMRSGGGWGGGGRTGEAEYAHILQTPDVITVTAIHQSHMFHYPQPCAGLSLIWSSNALQVVTNGWYII